MDTINTTDLPIRPGTPFHGGFFVGRIRVAGEEYILIAAPKGEGGSTPATRATPGTRASTTAASTTHKDDELRARAVRRLPLAI
jgi:hypothetical protein